MRASARTACTAALIGLLVPASVQAQWPTKEFEVISGERILPGPAGPLLVQAFNAASKQLDQWLVAWDMDPTGARIYVADAETRREIEGYLSEAAELMDRWGFPAPALAERGGRYEVVLATESTAALKGETASGTYHPLLCGIVDGRIFLRAGAILGDDGDGGGSLVTPHGHSTLAHELFHAVQANTQFLHNCPPGGGDWITEGTAEAVGLDVARLLRGEEVSDWRTAWGARDYSKRLPVPDDLSILPRPWTAERVAGYHTSSFWRYLAEYHATRIAGGEWPGPQPPGRGLDYSYLAWMLEQGRASYDCIGSGADCGREVGWLGTGLKSWFGRTLRDVYPRFAETLALYGDHRVKGAWNIGRTWRNEVFDECGYFELTPRGVQRVHREVIPSFEPVSMRCWTIVVAEYGTEVAVEVRVEGPPGGFALADLSAAVAGPPIWADTAFVQAETDPERLSASWIVDLAHDRENHFVLTNVARDPASTTRMTNLPITFTVLEPKALVSFSSSVSGQDPFDFDLGPPGSGVYEVPSDRLKFAVQYINADGNACVGGLNLPSADGDEQDLVTIWGGFPLPLSEGDFPIEPPTYSESDFPAPAPVTDGIRPGVLGGQVRFSCEHGGCGEEPWGAPVRPINAFRGTFRISKISRTQVIGSLDMVAVDEPVRVSATFVAPLGGPRGLSPGHPCAPVESDGTGPGQGSAPGSGSGPQPDDFGAEPGSGPDPSPDRNEGDPPTGPDSNTGPGAEADSRPDARTGPDASEESPGTADPEEDAPTGSDPDARIFELPGPELILDFLEGGSAVLQSRPQPVQGSVSDTNMTLVSSAYDLTLALPTFGCSVAPREHTAYNRMVQTAEVVGDRMLLHLTGGALRVDAATDGLVFELESPAGSVSMRAPEDDAIRIRPTGPTGVRGDVTGMTVQVTLGQESFTCLEPLNLSFTVSDER